MSVQIENIPQLQMLIKTCNLRVNSIEELKDLLATINASYNPDEARIKVGHLMGVAVPCMALGMAGGVSFFLVLISEGFRRGGPHALAALAVMWGAAALTSLVALILAVVFLRGRHAAPASAAPAEKPRPAGIAVLGERSTNVIPADQVQFPAV